MKMKSCLIIYKSSGFAELKFKILITKVGIWFNTLRLINVLSILNVWKSLKENINNIHNFQLLIKINQKIIF